MTNAETVVLTWKRQSAVANVKNDGKIILAWLCLSFAFAVNVMLNLRIYNTQDVDGAHTVRDLVKQETRGNKSRQCSSKRASVSKPISATAKFAKDSDPANSARQNLLSSTLRPSHVLLKVLAKTIPDNMLFAITNTAAE